MFRFGNPLKNLEKVRSLRHVRQFRFPIVETERRPSRDNFDDRKRPTILVACPANPVLAFAHALRRLACCAMRRFSISLSRCHC
jgi:hypothetical protein